MNVQHLCPLEFQCEQPARKQIPHLSSASSKTPSPRCLAKDHEIILFW